MKTKVAKKLNSDDGFMKIEINENQGLYRIKVLIKTVDFNGKPAYTQTCMSNTSIFDRLEDATKEAKRFLKKYQDHPELFK